MKLRNELLSKFKHDVGNLLIKITKIQKETNEACKEANALMEEFYILIDSNED